MASRFFTLTLTLLLTGVALAALAPSAWAEAQLPSSLDRAALPAEEVDWARVGDACAPCPATCAVSRRNLCCDYRDWNSCTWRFGATIGMYLAGMKGTIGVRGQEFSVDNSVGDSAEAFGKYGEAILQGGISVGKGRWSVDVMFSGMKFGKGADVEELGVRLNNELSIIQYQAKLYYRIAETELSCKSCPMLLVWEPMIGLRGNSIELAVEGPFGFLGVKQAANWVDPVVGCRITWDLRNRWAVVVDGDVGGFGVSSDLTWRLRAAVGYRFSKLFSLKLGWILLDTKYESGKGDERFVWDVLQSGPVLAATFSF